MKDDTRKPRLKLHSADRILDMPELKVETRPGKTTLDIVERIHLAFELAREAGIDRPDGRPPREHIGADLPSTVERPRNDRQAEVIRMLDAYVRRLGLTREEVTPAFQEAFRRWIRNPERANPPRGFPRDV